MNSRYSTSVLLLKVTAISLLTMLALWLGGALFIRWVQSSAPLEVSEVVLFFATETPTSIFPTLPPRWTGTPTPGNDPSPVPSRTPSPTEKLTSQPNTFIATVTTATPQPAALSPSLTPNTSARAPELSGRDSTTITRLIIPSLGIDAPVRFAPFDGYTWQMIDFQMDVALLGNTSLPGLGSNTVVGGHFMLQNIGPGPFFKLDKLRRGDDVLVYTEKNIYTYTMRERKTVDVTAMEVTYATPKPQLTLITCTSWDARAQEYSQRLIVVADLRKVEALSTATR
jgi:LPXTG-site transpeptidase (sortase) family protein